MAETSSRLVALKVLNKYKPQNTNLSEILGAVLDKTPGIKDHGFVRGLVWGVVRRLKTLDGIIAASSLRKQIDPEVRNILRLGLYQLIYCKDDIPDYAALGESVELAKKAHSPAVAGFVNAVLRKAQRAQDGETLYEGPPDVPSAISLKFSYPLWMVNRWMERFGSRETIAICEAGNTPGKMTIRANLDELYRDALKDLLESEGAHTEPCRFSPDGLRFISNPRLETLASFKRGLFCVQDEASQMISYMPSVAPGDDILDLCCGSGTKSVHMAQLARNGAKITAVDSSAGQLDLARKNIKTFGVKNIKLIKADVLKLADLKAKIVLLDAPCSGLGAIRHKPDIKWNRLESDIKTRYPKLQLELLNAAAECVKPGGTLVYCTCTTEPEENEQVVEKFLSSHGKFEVVKPDLPLSAEELITAGGYFRTFTHLHGTDGFFAAKMVRTQ